MRTKNNCANCKWFLLELGIPQCLKIGLALMIEDCSEWEAKDGDQTR